MPAAAPVRPSLPLGFAVCGMLTLCFSAFMLLLLLIAEVEGGTDAKTVALRGACVLLASLGVITTEALWKVRREAYPASVALTVCFAAWVMGEAAMQHTLAAGAGFLCVCALVVAPMLRYLHVRSRRLWPRVGARVPAPRP